MVWRAGCNRSETYGVKIDTGEACNNVFELSSFFGFRLLFTERYLARLVWEASVLEFLSLTHLASFPLAFFAAFPAAGSAAVAFAALLS